MKIITDAREEAVAAAKRIAELEVRAPPFAFTFSQSSFSPTHFFIIPRCRARAPSL